MHSNGWPSGSLWFCLFGCQEPARLVPPSGSLRVVIPPGRWERVRCRTRVHQAARLVPPLRPSPNGSPLRATRTVCSTVLRSSAYRWRLEQSLHSVCFHSLCIRKMSTLLEMLENVLRFCLWRSSSFGTCSFSMNGLINDRGRASQHRDFSNYSRSSSQYSAQICIMFILPCIWIGIVFVYMCDLISHFCSYCFYPSSRNPKHCSGQGIGAAKHTVYNAWPDLA